MACPLFGGFIVFIYIPSFIAMSVVAFDKLCWAFHIISSEKVILYFFCKFVLFQKYRSVLERQNILAIYSNNQRHITPAAFFINSLKY